MARPRKNPGGPSHFFVGGGPAQGEIRKFKRRQDLRRMEEKGCGRLGGTSPTKLPVPTVDFLDKLEQRG